tara:strand:- start:274 stop:879 length:606 start_codon:yes stop_codon:yes gene_type:complete
MDYVFININKYINKNTNDFIIINTNDIILNNKDNEQIILLDYNKFIKQILNSYIDDNDIFNQFKLDFYRTQVFINGFQLNDHEHFISFFKTLLSYNKLKELLSICSQTGLSEPYILVQKSLLKKNNNFIFSELSNKDKVQHKIKIKTYDNNININIHKKLRIIDLSTDIPKNLYYVDINLNLILDFDLFVTVTYNISNLIS